MGVPISTTYTADERREIEIDVLARLGSGEALYKILKSPGYPTSTTWWRWVWLDDELRAKVERAREDGVEARLAECDAIADGDDVVPFDGLMGADLMRAQSRADVKRAKLRIETRIKMAQMLKPKRFGPRLDLTTDGNALNKPPADDAEKAAALLRQVEKRLDPKTQDLLS